MISTGFLSIFLAQRIDSSAEAYFATLDDLSTLLLGLTQRTGAILTSQHDSAMDQSLEAILQTAVAGLTSVQELQAMVDSTRSERT